MKLSVCMIVRNESEVIARSLRSAFLVADEVIVVDTGSSDDTRRIASDSGASVYDYAWQDDFSAARNYSFSLASGEYIMWLDADDIIEEDSARKIKKLAEEGGFDVAMLNYSSGGLVYMRERILRREMNFLWQGIVHEVIVPRGKIIFSDAVIVHKKVRAADPMRNLSIYQRAIARGICLDERQKFYYARELFYNRMYEEAAAVLAAFIGGDGWSVNKAEACGILYLCHKNLGRREEARACLVKAFLYAAPRSRDCCFLADEFLSEGNLPCAEYWYRRAMDSPEKVTDGGFVDENYRTFVPFLGLAVVYDRKGDYAQAQRWNERAGAIRPDDKSYLLNKAYFASRVGGDKAPPA